MKINKYIAIIVLAASGIMTSCSDEYMNPTSASNFDSEYVFSTSDGSKKAVLGVYALFAQDSYTSRMSCVWMQNTDVEVTAPGAAPDGTRRDLWSLQAGLLTGFSDIKTAWDHNYLAIDRANQCIEGIKSSAVANTADMKMLLGESYCLRAYRYFLLCNFWGDVPYFRESAKAGMQLDIPKTDKNIIYSGMIQDLVNCEGDMYFADQFSDGIERMNREFALGMICRLSLFRAGYGMTKSGEMKHADDYLNVQNNDSLAVKYTINGVEKVARTSAEYYQLAKDYAQKLVSLRDRQLTDYATVFMNENKWIKPVNSDVLYEVAFGNTNGGGDVGWCIGVPVTASTYGATTIQVGYTPSYFFSFDAKDKRRDVCITRVSYTSDTQQSVLGVTSLAVGKWNRLQLKTAPGASSSKGTGINWPLMRYSDVLLMLAEAENELNGPTDLAKQMLKTVRFRAFSTDDYSTKVQAYTDSVSSSKEAFFNAIVNERAWEFGGECLRRFDLIRWNNFGKKIIETKTTLNNIGKALNGLELDNPDVAKYANYAKKMYYVQSADGKITFLNDYYQPTDAQLASWGTWTAISWGTSLYQKITATDNTVTYAPADYTTRCWRGYTDPTGLTPVPYILPISSQTVATSKYLKNEGYGLVLTNN
ncbi:MAG: RagB/SusD family nutrient uptake outer membrane protein [Bacteroidota bacterium]|nr:RagB/SusD family nutrient uptake outer membrane protein [Bacteroidota bacterium]